MTAVDNLRCFAVATLCVSLPLWIWAIYQHPMRGLAIIFFIPVVMGSLYMLFPLGSAAVVPGKLARAFIVLSYLLVSVGYAFGAAAVFMDDAGVESFGVCCIILAILWFVASMLSWKFVTDAIIEEATDDDDDVDEGLPRPLLSEVIFDDSESEHI